MRESTMRDAYAMRLHSVPSRFSHRVHQTPTLKNVFGALFYLVVRENPPTGECFIENSL